MVLQGEMQPSGTPTTARHHREIGAQTTRSRYSQPVKRTTMLNWATDTPEVLYVLK